MQGMCQKIEQLTAKIQDYVKSVYVRKLFWKCHMYGFTNLEKVIFKNLYCNVTGIYWKFQNTSQFQNKEKQISALIKSKTSYLLTKSGTAASYPLPIINLVTSWNDVFFWKTLWQYT